MDNMDKKAQLKLPKKKKKKQLLNYLASWCFVLQWQLKAAFLFVFQCLHSKNGGVCMQLL